MPENSTVSAEPSQRWVRATLGDTTVVDSQHPLLVRVAGEHGLRYAFGTDEVRTDLLPAEAIRAYPELPDHVTVAWDAADHWYEEDEEVFVGPRDPYHRVDAVRSRRHVQVRIDGEVVADTDKPVLVFETGLPVMYYVPREDVRWEHLVPTETRTGCPYKGFASYWTFTGGGQPRPDVAWSYLDPTAGESAKIKGYVAFYNTVAEHTVSPG